ncbi:lysophosphatidylserine lipase ABHD12, partial [Trichonephila clavata]
TLSHPEYYGLNCTRHFFVETSPGVLLGVWHIPPATTCYQMTSRLHYPLMTASHPETHQAHVITFDYRGFGDSTYLSPTAKTLEEDATAMFQWLKKYVPTSRIIVWGHSMGTGIALRLSQALANDVANNPFAVILEAPFTSIADATRTFPLSIFHRRMPLFEFFCSQRTRHPDTNLNSDERVGDVTAPVLILHAADDSMVWSDQGRKLWERAVQDRPNHLHRPVFVEFDGKYGCGHRNIHKAPSLSAEVVSFLKSVEEYNEKRQSYRE